MIHTGLCSVTFRQLKPGEIISLVSRAGLKGIEWGGDVHVKPGEIEMARTVRKMTKDAGIEVESYGSYYRVAGVGDENTPFEAVLETAVALGAPGIRVWAGTKCSADADPDYRSRVADETRRIADLANKERVTISFEFHGGTLTDTGESAADLLEAVGHPNVFSYWQVPAGQTFLQRMAGLKAILPWLSNLHVFWWQNEPRKRLALARGEEEWREYFHVAAIGGKDVYAFLEFVRNDDPVSFLEDAETLKRWVAEPG
jgi:sugar phosphate isomerase/epimerase